MHMCDFYSRAYILGKARNMISRTVKIEMNKRFKLYLVHEQYQNRQYKIHSLSDGDTILMFNTALNSHMANVYGH